MIIVEWLLGGPRRIFMKTRRSIDAAPLGFSVTQRGNAVGESASSATLALLDVEAGVSVHSGEPTTLSRRQVNGYLSVPTPPGGSESDRSRSTSPLYIGHNGFIFPHPAEGGLGGGSSSMMSQKAANAMMRFVSKTGDCNVRHSNVKRKGLKYLADIFTTLVDCQWRWCALIFALGFFSTWLMYALLYFVFSWLHDDLNRANLDSSEWTPCINKIHDFTSAYLYSVETQHTIGYGYRFANTECPHVIITLCLQCLTGVALQSILVGVLFAKLSRPKMRSETLMFSKEACICKRDGRMHFMFRIGDMRRSHIVEAHIRVMCMKERVTEEGEEIPFYQYDMDVGFSDGTDRLFLVWPTIVTHEIDERSPLFNLSSEDLRMQRLEIIVILEGIVEATGLTTQARTSYLPNEIRWGYRFEKVVRPYKDGSVRIDHDYFNKIYQVESTPRCSPKDLYQRQADDKVAENVAKGLPPDTLIPAPPPKPQYRRRSYTPQYMPQPHLQPENVNITFESVMTPTTSQQIRRCSTPGPTAREEAASGAVIYQDPLRCSPANPPAISMQPIELPRIR
ncbi:ATP-sensitive inward rectifier potassium channel 12 [Hypsibius exemplaris]|uniref:G protein-activated inward rectifier potassium channel 3 n=1 Tax=Hypsibius exemplaris TaxID=2072580 RepID=A0A1W0WEE5_HYPEX|nr:ATP-sensitive inward rectifier potassium channel 12 [Hypsibius exemplaris]